MDYIDREAVLRALDRHYYRDQFGNCVYSPAMHTAMKIIRDAPAAKHIVECRICRHACRPAAEQKGNRPLLCTLRGITVSGTDYCSHGELGGQI